VYLPPGYDDPAHEDERYPVLWALAGFTGRGIMMLNAANWGEPLHVRLDRLHAEGRIGAMIVAFPDCFTRYGGSQYVDSSAVGNYATHLVEELVPFIDLNLRTLASARHRGIFGKSSGGFGALWHAMRRPDVFGAVACHSGDMAFEYCYFPDFPKLLQQILRHGSAAAFLRAFDAAPRKTGEMIGAINMLAMAACYAPNPRRRPLGFDLPFDPATGAIDRAVWRKWLAFDPLRLLPRRAAALRRMRLLFLDCGRRDEYHLLWGARQMAAALGRHRVRHVYEEFDDGHMDIAYRFDRSLPLLWQAVQPLAGAKRAARR
jgi:enterochelin esterase family protein